MPCFRNPVSDCTHGNQVKIGGVNIQFNLLDPAKFHVELEGNICEVLQLSWRQ